MKKRIPAPLEIKILQRLWTLGEPATVQEIGAAWSPPDEAPGYTTILKKLQVMEEKGFVEHEKDGKAYRYSTRLNMREIEKAKIKELQEGFYAGNRMSLVLGFLRNAEISDEELVEARRLLADLKNGETK